MAEQPRGQMAEFVSKDIDGPFLRLAMGVTSLEGAMNPQTETITYINDFSSTTTTGFEPAFPIDGNIYTGDPANQLLYDMAWTMARGDNATVYFLRVQKFEDGDATGTFKAKRFLCNFAPGSDGGGAGGETLTFSGELQPKGRAIFGEATITIDTATGNETATFVADDVQPD
jgi:hypothetical protein